MILEPPLWSHRSATAKEKSHSKSSEGFDGVSAKLQHHSWAPWAQSTRALHFVSVTSWSEGAGQGMAAPAAQARQLRPPPADTPAANHPESRVALTRFPKSAQSQAPVTPVLKVITVHCPCYRNGWGAWLLLQLPSAALVAAAMRSPILCLGFPSTKVTFPRSMPSLMSLQTAARQLSNEFRPLWNGLVGCKLFTAYGTIGWKGHF